MSIIIGLGNNWRQELPVPCPRSDRCLSLESRLTAFQAGVQYKIALVTDPNSILILSGGRTNTNIVDSEASAMLQYLKHMNLVTGEERILLEESSLNTPENSDNVHELLVKNNIDIDSELTIVSSPFHVPRALQAFRKRFTNAALLGIASTTPIADNHHRNAYAKKKQLSRDWYIKTTIDTLLRLIGTFDTNDNIVRFLTRQRGK